MKHLLIILLLSPGVALANDLADAITAFDKREYHEARDKFQLIAAERGDPDVLFYLAVSQFRAHQIDAASGTLEKLFKVAPEHVNGHYLEGLLWMAKLNEVNVFRKVGVAKSALSSWQRVVSIEPENDMGLYAIFSFFFQAPGIAGGDKEEAAKVLSMLEQLESPYADMAKATIANDEEDFEMAEKLFISATKKISDRGGPYFALAQFYFQQERYEDSLEILDRYELTTQAWHDPDRAMTYFYRGNILTEFGKPDQARASYQKALSAKPNQRIRKLTNEALEAF